MASFSIQEMMGFEILTRMICPPSKRVSQCHCYTKFRRSNMPPKKRNKPAVRLTSNMYPLCSRMSKGDAGQLRCVAQTNLEQDLWLPYSPFTKVTGSNFLSDIILLYLYIIHRCCRRWCWCWKRLWKSFKRVRNAQTQACKQSGRQTTAIHRNVKENITHKIQHSQGEDGRTTGNSLM